MRVGPIEIKWIGFLSVCSRNRQIEKWLRQAIKTHRHWPKLDAIRQARAEWKLSLYDAKILVEKVIKEMKEHPSVWDIKG